jgi:preprotein translocase subunit SecD
MPPGTPLPACSAASALTAANLGIEPDGSDPAGYTSNLPATPTDASFATVPSTGASDVTPSDTVLLPGALGTGSTRDVLGPAGVTGVDVASATVRRLNGQWLIELNLTPTGSTAWDTLAQQQFHALVGVVLHGRVLSAPVIQPTQSAFTSFAGQLDLSGSFTRAQATAAASAIVGSD